MNNFDELMDTVEAEPLRKVAVAVAQDITVIQALDEARRRNVAECVLFGDETEIRRLSGEADIDLRFAEVVDEPSPIRAVAAATRMVRDGDADILMKGYVHTDDFLRGVLHKEHGLRTGSIMSHVFVVEQPEEGRLIYVTDAAMNIAPDLEQKAAILLNAVYLARLYGIERPKVAVLAAVELVNPAMPATLEAAALAKMADRRQYSPGPVVDGPFALDNAVSPSAASHKNITGPVAGAADVLVVPDVEAGNIFVKGLVYFAGRRAVGLLVGAAAPVVLTSRADTRELKLLSVAGAVLMVNRAREMQLKVGKVHY
jgi:phosphate butyryltransferase